MRELQISELNLLGGLWIALPQALAELLGVDVQANLSQRSRYASRRNSCVQAALHSNAGAETGLPCVTSCNSCPQRTSLRSSTS